MHPHVQTYVFSGGDNQMLYSNRPCPFISKSSLKQVLSRVGGVSLLTLLFMASASGQTFRGGIQGVVTDPNGAVIAGADVTVANPDTGLTRTAQTDDSGSYLFSELPIGTYQITARKSGFHDLTVKSVKVEVSATTRIDITLPVGTNVDVVDVVAQEPIVNAAENNLGGTIGTKQLQELPVSGRDFTKMLVL